MDVTLGRWIRRGDDALGLRANIGRPTWGPAAMLADLELRLGLPRDEASAGERVLAFTGAARKLAQATPSPFFARSSRVDREGTARALLEMRDSLVEAGWRSDVPVPDGGPRLSALAELDVLAAVPRGRSDRLAAVAGELARVGDRPLERLALLDPLDAWPGAWRTIFARLSALGTRVEAARLTLPGADRSSDLGFAQAVLRGESPPPGKSSVARRLQRDGSLIHLRAPTSWELGEATAALLGARGSAPRARSVVVVRAGDPVPLESALVAQGERSQGRHASSALRPLLQLLPLALSLLFRPRDVHHVLELLSLPIGPIPARDRHALLKALSEAAGVGSRAWLAALEKLTPEIRERVAAWIEPPSFDRGEGAPREAVIAAIDRVRTWAAACRQLPESGSLFGPLLTATEVLRDAVQTDERDRLSASELDRLLAHGSDDWSVEHGAEQPGRAGHVDSPFDVLAPRPVVILWHAGVDPTTPPRDLFRRAERDALEAAGIRLAVPAAELQSRATAWRRAALAATDLLIVATPDTHLGAPQSVLPVWDEIAARLAHHEILVQPIQVTAEALREGVASWAVGDTPIAEDHEPLSLPAPGGEWRVDRAAADAIEAATRKLSATSLGSLLGCPLRFVLEKAAGLRSARIETLGAGPLLHGKLGHRLIEELHRAELLLQVARVQAEAPAILDRLMIEEAGPLHRLGRRGNREQVRRRLLDAAVALAEVLVESRMTVEGVELSLEAADGDGTLHGRLDLLLRDATGAPVVLDLKWGSGTYYDQLAAGHAFQLAHYAEVVRRARDLPALPPAAYFSLSGARVMATGVTPLARTTIVRGPPLADTARGIAVSLEAVRAHLRKGRIPATGVGPEPEHLAAALGKPSLLTLPATSACTYCDMGAVCGRAWEGLA